MVGRKAPKFTPRVWRGIPVSKIPALLDSAPHPRDRILLALGCFLLGRGIEFSLLRIGDVRLDAGEISYAIPKTGKTDVLPISTELDGELRRWFTVYTEECGPLDPSWYLVPAKTPPRLSGYRTQIEGSARLIPDRPICTTKRKGTMHRVAQAALESIGFPLRDPESGKSLREGMHTLRRSIARGLYLQLVDEWQEGDPNPIEMVRSMLNHSTEKQTREYIGLQADRELRDRRIKGRPMFPGLAPGSNVVQLGEAREARSAGS
jgi:integrase